MALTENKILKIKVDYEVGKLSRSAIGKKHRISQPTLRRHAEQGEWKYKKRFKEVSEIVELKSIERLIEKEVDKTSIVNEKFLKESEFAEGLALSYLSDIAKNKKDKVKQTKSDADDIFAFIKSCKITSEILNMNYNNKRKMLGMDKETEDNKNEGVSSISFVFNEKLKDES